MRLALPNELVNSLMMFEPDVMNELPVIAHMMTDILLRNSRSETMHLAMQTCGEQDRSGVIGAVVPTIFKRDRLQEGPDL